MKHGELERMEAIAIGLLEGSKAASQQTGIPQRTIYSWLMGERPAPELAGAIANNRTLLSITFREAIAEATTAVLTGLRDPKVSLRKKAQTLVILRRHEQVAREMGLAWEEVAHLLGD